MKTKRFSQALLASAVILAFATPAGANLITNGSFENTTGFVGNTDDIMSLLAGSTVMTGWQVVGDSLAWIGPATSSVQASSGGYFLDLTDYDSGAPFGGVEQTISTVIGQSYELLLDLGSSSQFGLPSAILASAGSASQVFSSTLTGLNEWQTFALSFTASSTTTTISLIGNTGNHYIGLDNVSVEERGVNGVPEPASLALLGIGLAGLGAMRRRKA